MTQMEVLMRTMSIFKIFGVAALAVLWQSAAWAQETPRDIQGLIASGQDQAALGQLQGVLQAHPDSGVAWYLSAEAQDALGHESAARSALAKAEHFSPGLPFAQPNDVAALRAHLQGGGTGMGHGGIGIGGLLIGALVVWFVISRLFRRRRYQPGFGGFQGQAPNGYPPPGYGPGGGGGMGGSLLSGLAAGAGFAVGERVVDDMMGRDQGGFIDPAQGQDVPDRDDGLTGSPGWDDGSNDSGGGGFDSGNDW
jgi:hypothetical protein